MELRSHQEGTSNSKCIAGCSAQGRCNSFSIGKKAIIILCIKISTVTEISGHVEYIRNSRIKIPFGLQKSP